ncbi:hypothetical protein BDW75DRAFT_66398 [Aspergillus navahoensis]
MISWPASMRACQDRCSILSLARGRARSILPPLTARASISSLRSFSFHLIESQTPPLWSGKSIVPHPTLPRGSLALRGSTPYIFTCHCQSVTLPRSPLPSTCPVSPTLSGSPRHSSATPPPLLPLSTLARPHAPAWLHCLLAYGHASSTLLTALPLAIQFYFSLFLFFFSSTPRRFCCDLPAHTGLQTDYSALAWLTIDGPA